MRHDFQKCCESVAHLTHSGVHWRLPRKVDPMVQEVLDAAIFDGLQRHRTRELG